jgi:hypothetical protein
MRRFGLCCLTMAVACAAGCLEDWPKNNASRAGSGPGIPPRDKLPVGSLEAATRVDSLGRKLLADNPDITIRPMFLSIGVLDVTAFHRGTAELYVSDGLVSKCKNDGELAAVLSSELAKMVAEAKLAGPVRPPEREPPFAPRVGSDTVGSQNAPDFTDVAERAKFEQRNPPRRIESAVPTAPDTGSLATGYLTKAGFSADDLEHVSPLIRQAEANPKFEKQLVSPRREALGIPGAQK